jgi:cell division protein FtsI (penicillin-binding protein 3)
MGAWSTPLDSMAKTASPAIPAKAATANAYDILMEALGKKIPVPGGDQNYRFVQAVTDTTRHTEIKEKNVYRGVMPDVMGMRLKDAVYMLENYGVHVHLTGRGKVMAQSVPAGTRLLKGQEITLQLG